MKQTTLKSALKWFNVVIAIMLVGINSYIIYFLHELEKKGCKCALDWQRNGIMFLTSIYVIVILLQWTMGNKLSKQHNNWVRITILSVMFANIVLIYQYIYVLYKEQCHCPGKFGIEALEFVAVYFTCIFVLALLALLWMWYKHLRSPK